MLPLFAVTTDRVRMTWSGPEAPPDATAGPGRIVVRALRPGAEARVERGGAAAASGAALRLAEQTAYRVFIASRTGDPVSVAHDDPLATSRLVDEDGGRVVAGSVDFGGQVGQSRFVVAVGGVPELAVEVEVFPTKLAAADVEAMRTEIDETLAGLAFAYLRATASPQSLGAGAPRRATWLTLLRRVLPDLDAALTHIAAHPHRELRREPHPVRAEQVRRPDATVRAAVRAGQGAGAWAALPDGVPLRSVLPERLARATLDTAEHRWLRGRIDAARRALAELQTAERRLPRSERRRRVLRDINEAEHRLVRMTHLNVIAAASPSPPPAPTPRLLTAPGYAEAHAACRVLDLSLTLAEGAVPHATKDLWLLYEMYGYLAVARAVALRLGMPIPEHAFFQAEHRGVRFLLRSGRRHAIHFERDGLDVGLVYNPRFPAGRGLLAQRPDLLLTVRRGGRTRRFVLDAKYRRDDGPGYVRRYGAPGPPEPALGDLHRYRDAIVEDGARTVEQAVALFPYRADERFAESRLWGAVEHVGVGAIPLVPGQATWLDRWLRRVLH